MIAMDNDSFNGAIDQRKKEKNGQDSSRVSWRVNFDRKHMCTQRNRLLDFDKILSQ